MIFTFFGFFYLATLPFVVFSHASPYLIFVSLSIGVLLFFIFQKPSIKLLVIFSLTLFFSLIVLKPKIGLDWGVLNSINAQRGEHSNFLSSLYPRLIHNKTNITYSFVKNLDKLLSPSSIFAFGFWHHLSPYYPLGCLFPWDIYFIYLYLKKEKDSLQSKITLPFIFSILSLVVISGLIYLDEAQIFSYGVIFFLAIIASFGYSQMSKRNQFVFFVLNTAYLIYHLVVTGYFKI